MDNFIFNGQVWQGFYFSKDSRSKIFLNALFISLKGVVTKRRQKRDLPSTNLLPKWPKLSGLGPAQARSFILLCHVGAGTQVLVLTFTVFPSILTGSRIGSGTLKTHISTHMGSWYYRQWLKLIFHKAGPLILGFKYETSSCISTN